MPDRNFLKQLAADTIKIAENGYYIIGNRKIVLSIEFLKLIIFLE